MHAQNSGMEKVFLYHVYTKLHVGTDSSPVDAKTHEICGEFIDLFTDFNSLYECV
jgi:Ras-related GTP-binding protein C/D